ncbi:MAG: hypothetical protein QM756_21735 [Polyangiaceae bacterium]
MRSSIWLLSGALLLPACGSDAPTNKNGNIALGTGPLLPWKVGNKWTYRVTDGVEVTDKTTTVVAEEPVGGGGESAALPAYRVVTRKGTDLNDETESWQAPLPDAPDKVVRYREILVQREDAAADAGDHLDALQAAHRRARRDAGRRVHLA